MANKIKAKLALRLLEVGVSANKVYAARRISKKSQKEVLDVATGLGMTYADVADLPDDEVYKLFFPGRNNHASVFEEPDWEYVHREMAKVGVFLRLLHKEYRDVCGESSSVAMGLTGSASDTANTPCPSRSPARSATRWDACVRLTGRSPRWRSWTP